MKRRRPTEPEFEELKRRREAAIQAGARELGWDGKEPLHAHVNHGGGTPECYCACPDGPCQHEFEGWRAFEDGRGGERVCKRCGMGAMSHDLRVLP